MNYQDDFRLKYGALWRLVAIFAMLAVCGVFTAVRAMAADPSATPMPGGSAGAASMPGESTASYNDPLEPFNSAMFTFNMKLDKWVVTPVAKGYSLVLPEPARVSVGNFFDNVNFLPRFANNLFQLRFQNAATELARFGINTTLGAGGLFDVANSWFGLKRSPDDFGLTLGHYGVYSGAYLMLPFFGPSNIRDAVGLAADGAMNPMAWVLPWWITVPVDAGSEAIQAVNYRSLHPKQFEEADRYAIDLYGAVQDAYTQTRAARLKEINNGD